MPQEKTVVVVTNSDDQFNEIELQLRRAGYSSITWQTTMPKVLPLNTHALVVAHHSFDDLSRHLFQTLHAEKKIGIITGFKQKDELLEKFCTERQNHHVIYKRGSGFKSLALPLQ